MEPAQGVAAVGTLGSMEVMSKRTGKISWSRQWGHESRVRTEELLLWGNRASGAHIKDGKALQSWRVTTMGRVRVRSRAGPSSMTERVRGPSLGHCRRCPWSCPSKFHLCRMQGRYSSSLAFCASWPPAPRPQGFSQGRRGGGVPESRLGYWSFVCLPEEVALCVIS